MPKIVDLSEFGEWCESNRLSRKDVQHLTNFNDSYVSQLFSKDAGRSLSEFLEKFFYEWWGSVFTNATKAKLLGVSFNAYQKSILTKR